MKKTKEQKGITLIALIITIVILLILAVVTINAIQGDGILRYAQNAASDYEEAQDNEIATLDGYVSKIEDSLSSENKEPVMPVATINTKVDENSTINGEAYSSTNPVIPAGFKAINVETEGHESYWDAKDGPEVEEGLVISDGNSEFVWIPVPILSEFAKTTSGKDANGRTNYEGVLYDFSATTATEKSNYGQSTTSHREPANLDTTYDNTANLSIWAENLYQESFNKMVESVAKYGGFYVGRYETSLNGSIARSKFGEKPMNSVNWFDAYEYSSTYSLSNESLGVESEMIWGCQWDAMLRFILTGDEADHVTSKSNVSHNLSSIYLTGGTNYTGSVTYNDIASNIYDLEGNVIEWSQEASDTIFRLRQGGNLKGGVPPCEDFESTPSGNFDSKHGSRLTLYIK